MLFNGSPMEQAMPATGLGLGPGNISPGSLGQGPGPTPQMVQGLPPHYNGSYHPSYMQQNIQVKKAFLCFCRYSKLPMRMSTCFRD